MVLYTSEDLQGLVHLTNLQCLTVLTDDIPGMFVNFGSASQSEATVTCKVLAQLPYLTAHHINRMMPGLTGVSNLAILSVQQLDCDSVPADVSALQRLTELNTYHLACTAQDWDLLRQQPALQLLSVTVVGNQLEAIASNASTSCAWPYLTSVKVSDMRSSNLRPIYKALAEMTRLTDICLCVFRPDHPVPHRVAHDIADASSGLCTLRHFQRLQLTLVGGMLLSSPSRVPTDLRAEIASEVSCCFHSCLPGVKVTSSINGHVMLCEPAAS